MKKPKPSEQRILLSNISWQKFENLLLELGEERTTRLTYLRGKLEMMNPLPEHERCRKLLESLILVVSEELQQPVEAIAPVLLKHPRLECSTEPDACYYLQTPPPDDLSPREGIPTTLEFPQDPTPDLVTEVSLNKSQIDKLPVYAMLGIPEVWRYFTTSGDEVLEGDLVIYQLQQDRYVEMPRSSVFPFLTGDRILQFIQQSDSMTLQKALTLLRQWVKEHK